MLDANPALTPAQVRDILIATAQPVPGASWERQGAGALNAGQAVAQALRMAEGPLAGQVLSPHVNGADVTFILNQPTARQVEVVGSWDDWRVPGLTARSVAPGVWQAHLPRPAAGEYRYKFLVDEVMWLDDPSNTHKAYDGYGGLNSLLSVE
jgi:hypothetical protein